MAFDSFNIPTVPESIECGQHGTLTWEPTKTSLGQPRQRASRNLSKGGDFPVWVHADVQVQ